MSRMQLTKVMHPSPAFVPANGRPVVRVRVEVIGPVYPSIVAAAEAMSVFPNSLREALENGTDCAGFHWWNADMPVRQPVKSKKKMISVINLNTGETFPTIWAAAGSDRAKWNGIRRSIERYRPYRGEQWEQIK